MADKNFKVKNGLDIATPIPVSMGGTGQTSTTNTLNALLPLQTSSTNYFLQTDGTNALWAIPSYSIISDNSTAKNARAKINFIGALISDDSGNNSTNVTIIGSPLDILDGGSFDSVAPYDGGYYNTASYAYTFDGGTP